MSASKLKPYPSYKKTGLDWHPEVPLGWELMRLKRIATIRPSNVDKKSYEGEPVVQLANYVDVYHNDQITEKIDFMNATASKEEITKFSLIGGDVIITKDSEAWDDIAVPAFVPKTIEGVVCGYHLTLIRPNKELVLGDYLSRTFQSVGFRDQYHYNANGVTRFGLGSYWVNNGIIPIPTVNEQRLIADYINTKTASISDSVAKLYKFIKTLEQKRSSHVHNALIHEKTRHIRLGQVVEHVFRPIERIQTETYHPLGLYNRGRGIFIKPPTLGAELGDSNFFYVKSDDLILSGQFAWEGAVALADKHHSGCVVSHRYPVLKGKMDLLDSAYLQAFFNTEYGDFILNQHSRGAAGRNRPLNIGSLLKEKIPIPPIEAQLEVSRLVYLERKIRIIFEKYAMLLKEYRTALISAAVTGKIDVRGQA